MDGSVKIHGLDDVMRTLEKAFPNDTKKQQSLVHSAMGGAARKSILETAKQLAYRGDSSGSLSESLGVRVQNKRKRAGKAGGMEVVPVRYNKKAIAKYIQHYYTDKGKNPDGNVIVDGIRHGHLVEFGTVGMPAYPFLWPAGRMQASNYRNQFADVLKKRIESAVRREAKKKAGK